MVGQVMLTPQQADLIYDLALQSLEIDQATGEILGAPGDHDVDAVNAAMSALRSSRTDSRALDLAISDVREFHLALSESPVAMVVERTGPPALVRRAERHRLLREEYDEYVDATMDNDVPGVLDAIVDCIYVLIGTGLVQFGGDRLAEAWSLVHASNMAKRWPDGSFHLREDGKVTKPPGWAGPDIAKICSVDLRTLDPACSTDECHRFRHGPYPFCEGVCLRAHPNVTSAQIAMTQAEDMADGDIAE